MLERKEEEDGDGDDCVACVDGRHSCDLVNCIDVI